MKKFFAAALLALLLTAVCGLGAAASVPNPLAQEGVGIRLLDDFNDYADASALLGHPVSKSVQKMIAMDRGAVLLTLNGKWFDTEIPIKGFSKSGGSGSLAGAAGLGVYLDGTMPGNITNFNPALFVQEGSQNVLYQVAPEQRYYLVSADGVTYEGTSQDSGWGEGFIGDIGIGFEGYLLVPFSSLQRSGQAFDPETMAAKSLQVKGYFGDLRFDNVFLYGKGLADENAEEIRAFFHDPEPVEIPQNYQLTDRLVKALGVGEIPAAPAGTDWTAVALAGAAGALIILAAFLITRRPGKEAEKHEN